MRYLIILLFCSCGISQKKIVDSDKEYIYKRTNGSDHKLTLRPDSTFEYIARGHMWGAQSKGYWKIKNNELSLTSLDSYRTNYCWVVDSIGKPCALSESFLFYVKDAINNLPVPYLNMKYEGSIYVTDLEGRVEFKKGTASKLVLSFLGDECSCTIKNIDSSCQNIMIVLQDRSKFYYNNEIWRIKGKKIIIGKDMELRLEGKTKHLK